MWIDFKLYFYVRIHKSALFGSSTAAVVNWFQIVFLREDSQEWTPKRINQQSCELISNCIFTWGFTRLPGIIILNVMLWIDFKLYFYVRIHKFYVRIHKDYAVVNWFQIVFLREDSQATHPSNTIPLCCELISNCIFTWGFTRKIRLEWKGIQLWIDFKLYFYVRIHKKECLTRMADPVVNWFQIVFLREDSQASWNRNRKRVRCELISNCIFTWGFTRNIKPSPLLTSLWIDFKLYFYVRIHKVTKASENKLLVVNWFQIVFLREDSQVFHLIISFDISCELISNCIFTWGFTREAIVLLGASTLWIDFKLYFYVRIHKVVFTSKLFYSVVNWFQIVFLREDSQENWRNFKGFVCCELISNCIFTWGFTRYLL